MDGRRRSQTITEMDTWRDERNAADLEIESECDGKMEARAE
jgi:hypothetical protein